MTENAPDTEKNECDDNTEHKHHKCGYDEEDIHFEKIVHKSERPAIVRQNRRRAMSSLHPHYHDSDERADDNARKDVREPVEADRRPRGNYDRKEKRQRFHDLVAAVADDESRRERTSDGGVRRRPAPKYPVLEDTEIKIPAAVHERGLSEELGLNPSRDPF